MTIWPQHAMMRCGASRQIGSGPTDEVITDRLARTTPSVIAS